MPSILHISDLHFGPYHLPDLATGVLELARERQPDVVAISGDLTQRAKPRQFQAARDFVAAIPAPTLVVPGNHDVPLYRVWERIFLPFAAYRRHFKQDLEPCYENPEMLIVGVNTAFNWTLVGGRIRRNRLAAVVRQFAGVPPAVLKVVLAHHPLVPAPSFGEQEVLLNAQEAVEHLSRAGVDLVLSGHFHQSFIASSASFYPAVQPPLLIVHTGTTTSRRGRGAERGKNTCCWIEVDKSTIVIIQCLWDAEGRRFVETSRHEYPRQSLSARPLAPCLAASAAPQPRQPSVAVRSQLQ